PGSRDGVQDGADRDAGVHLLRSLVKGTARALSLVALLAAPADSGSSSAAGTGAARPAPQLTRADLAVLRRRAALLESELARARGGGRSGGRRLAAGGAGRLRADVPAACRRQDRGDPREEDRRARRPVVVASFVVSRHGGPGGDPPEPHGPSRRDPGAGGVP